jgi:hypothetical protein
MALSAHYGVQAVVGDTDVHRKRRNLEARWSGAQQHLAARHQLGKLPTNVA